MTCVARIPSPMGELTLASDGEALTGLWMSEQKYFAATLPADVRERGDLPLFLRAEDWPRCGPQEVLSGRRCGSFSPRSPTGK